MSNPAATLANAFRRATRPGVLEQTFPAAVEALYQWLDEQAPRPLQETKPTNNALHSLPIHWHWNQPRATA